MADSRQQLLEELLDLERRADGIRARLNGGDDDSAVDVRWKLDEHSLTRIHRLVIDNLAEAVLIADMSGTLLDANRPARQMFELTRRRFGEVTLDDTIGDLLDPLGPDWSDRLRNDGALGSRGEVTVGSARFEAELLMVAVNDLPRPCVVALIRNVSATLRAERQNRKLVERLRQKHQELEAFTFRISHDLKTPLVSISGFSKLIAADLQTLDDMSLSEFLSESVPDREDSDGSSPNRSLPPNIAKEPAGSSAVSESFANSERSSTGFDPDDSHDDDSSINSWPTNSPRPTTPLELIRELRDHAQELRKATIKAQKLIDQLLDLARVSQATLSIERQPIRKLVDMSLRAHRPDLQGARIRVEIDAELGIAWGDFHQLSSVFDNLIGNAIRYLEGVAEPVLGIRYERQHDRDIWSIEDNGPGIDPADRARVFEPFVRLDRDRKGSGVGLAIVRRIVEMHGGDVWIESPPHGIGTRVRFSIARQP